MRAAYAILGKNKHEQPRALGAGTMYRPYQADTHTPVGPAPRLID